MNDYEIRSLFKCITMLQDTGHYENVAELAIKELEAEFEDCPVNPNTHCKCKGGLIYLPEGLIFERDEKQLEACIKNTCSPYYGGESILATPWKYDYDFVSKKPELKITIKEDDSYCVNMKKERVTDTIKKIGTYGIRMWEMQFRMELGLKLPQYNVASFLQKVETITKKFVEQNYKIAIYSNSYLCAHMGEKHLVNTLYKDTCKIDLFDSDISSDLLNNLNKLQYVQNFISNRYHYPFESVHPHWAYKGFLFDHDAVVDLVELIKEKKYNSSQIIEELRKPNYAYDANIDFYTFCNTEWHINRDAKDDIANWFYKDDPGKLKMNSDLISLYTYYARLCNHPMMQHKEIKELYTKLGIYDENYIPDLDFLRDNIYFPAYNKMNRPFRDDMDE